MKRNLFIHFNLEFFVVLFFLSKSLDLIDVFCERDDRFAHFSDFILKK